MNKLRKVYAIILIILGSFLEIFYYSQNFIFDGVPHIIAWIIAVSLTVALTTLSSFYKKFFSWIIIIPLAVFSIYITSSGQAAYLQESQKTETIEISQEENRQEQLEYYMNEIYILNNDLEQLSKQITANTTWTRQKYSDTIEAVQQRQDEIREEKRILQEKIEQLRPALVTNKQIEQFKKYDLYNEIFKADIKIKQFITHVLLSFFIAILAPIGIIILSTRKRPEPQQPKRKPRKINYLPYIRRWVQISWTGNRRNKDYKKILDKQQFLKYYNDRFEQKAEKFRFTDAIYDRIKNAAIDQKCVDKNNNIVNNYSEEWVINLIDKKLK